jgi:hypothetical protein
MKLESGESVFDAEDMTEGMVIIVEYQWFLNGEMVGNGSKLVIRLGPGEHVLKLRGRGQDGTWYETTRTVGGGPGNAATDPNWILLVPAALVLVAVVLSITVLAFFIINRRRGRSGQDEEVVEWEEDVVAIEIPEPSEPKGPKGPTPRVSASHYHREVPQSVKSGSIDHIEGEFPGGEEEDETTRGPVNSGPHPSITDELDDIGLEALSWKRPSRFTMKREKMLRKLEKKRRSGEVDEDLYLELKEFILRNMN